MKVNKKLMGKVRKVCEGKDDRKYVRELVSLARDDLGGKSIYRMFDKYGELLAEARA